jgi:hypothetical protein
MTKDLNIIARLINLDNGKSADLELEEIQKSI